MCNDEEGEDEGASEEGKQERERRLYLTVAVIGYPKTKTKCEHYIMRQGNEAKLFLVITCLFENSFSFLLSLCLHLCSCFGLAWLLLLFTVYLLLLKTWNVVVKQSFLPSVPSSSFAQLTAPVAFKSSLFLLVYLSSSFRFSPRLTHINILH